MTKSADKILIDAQTVTDLVKKTAETTTMSVNVSYIQRDILEIKATLKEMINMQNDKIDQQNKKIDGLERIVWTGMGIAISVSVFLKLLIR